MWIGLLACVCRDVRAESPVLLVPKVTEPLQIDGRLDEPCYRAHPPLTRFTQACAPEAQLPRTEAWLFWSAQRLVVAFECTDPTPASQPATDNERDVNPQDRAELFLWSGAAADPYYCLEIAPQGALHDYRAEFYRKFDHAWQPTGWTYQTRMTETGYCVEASINKAGLAEIGFPLAAEQTWRVGLFRADFDRLGGTPRWICWVDGQTAEPDFHTASSFGRLRLKGK